MREDFLKQAVSGTAHHHDVLLEAADFDIHRRASLKVQYSSEAWVSFATQYRIENPVPTAAIQYWYVMRTGLHREALLDWFLAILEQGYQLQIELVASIVDFVSTGWIYKQWFPIVRQILGTEGMDIAKQILEGETLTWGQKTLLYDENQAHDWIQMPEKLHNVTQLLRQAISQSKLIFPEDLRSHLWVWSYELTRAFCEYKTKNEPFPWIFNNIKDHVYHFSLDLTADDVNCFISLLGDDDHGKQMLRSVLDFRQRMVAAIKGDQL